MTILLIVLVVLIQYLDTFDQVWKSAAADPFIEARNAFETVAQNLAAATLAPYQDYADNTGAFNTGGVFSPDHLARRSDLDFVCGPCAGAGGLLASSGRIATGDAVFFLAPNGYTQTYMHSGMERLLNAMGYFVEFGDDEAAPSFVLLQSHRWRWRLKQILQPAESLQIFATKTSSDWIQQVVPTGAFLPILADNVIALIVLPERSANDSGPSLAPLFSYDSRDTGNRLTLHQLPPRLRVVLVAIDPASAERLAAQNGASAPSLVAVDYFQHPAQTDAAQQSAQLTADLASLDQSLTAQKIGHRIFQREILLTSSTWSNTPSP